MLRDLPFLHDPRVLSGRDLADDAGIFRLSEELALIQTVDFFTPVVDDPYTFGQIAAANALSDIYAMGGTPLTALNITVFPTKSLPLDLLSHILRGGSEKAAEAGVSIIGGHTVEGEEPMYGMSVTGTIHPDRIVQPSGGMAGDVLVLTKPLGTGVIATALKAGRASEEHERVAIGWMSRLNDTASRAMIRRGAHASTDVTGFGLLGHLGQWLEPVVWRPGSTARPCPSCPAHVSTHREASCRAAAKPISSLPPAPSSTKATTMKPRKYSSTIRRLQVDCLWQLALKNSMS